MVRRIKRKWRRFYRTHREVGDFVGALSVFVFIFELYFIGILLGGH